MGGNRAIGCDEPLFLTHVREGALPHQDGAVDILAPGVWVFHEIYNQARSRHDSSDNLLITLDHDSFHTITAVSKRRVGAAIVRELLSEEVEQFDIVSLEGPDEKLTD